MYWYELRERSGVLELTRYSAVRIISGSVYVDGDIGFWETFEHVMGYLLPS